MSIYEQSCTLRRTAVFLCLLALGASISAAGVSSLAFSINSASAGHGRVAYQGEAIYVQARIARSEGDAMEDKSINVGSESLPWRKNVTFAVYRLEEETAAPQTTQKKQGKVLCHIPFEQAYARSVSGKWALGVGKRLEASWVIGPDTTSNMPAGKYLIQAVFDTTDKKDTYPEILSIRLPSSRDLLIELRERPRDGSADADIAESKASYLLYQDKFDEAVVLYKLILKDQPSRQDLHCGLARVYEVKGDHKLAILEYRRYVEWARQVPITATNAAFRHEHAEIIEGTIRALETRVQRDEQK